MRTLKVDNPCPVLLLGMKEKDSGYYCKSCCNEVVDFRGKGELKKVDVSAENLCSIFDMSQLPAQKEMSFKNKIIFYALTFCSFLGFSVQPIRASDTLSTKYDNVVVETSDSLSVGASDSLSFKNEKKYSKRKRRRRRKWFKKKKKFTPVGCPSF